MFVNLNELSEVYSDRNANFLKVMLYPNVNVVFTSKRSQAKAKLSAPSTSLDLSPLQLSAAESSLPTGS